MAARQAARPVRAGEQRQALLATQHQRLMMLLLLFAAAILLVIGRLAMLALDASPRRAAAIITAPRGDIVDRNGAQLARTIDAWTIGVHPDKLLGDRNEIAKRLADLMPDTGDQADFYRLINKPVSFTYLNRRASPALVQAVNAIGEPGIVFERETQRLYPQASLAAHVLGYIGPTQKDLVVRGRSGMERALEERLTNPALSGTPVALSIDSRVQAAMESELGSAMAAMQARAAAGVVLDVDTGEVISMVSLPLFNPNRVGMSGTEQLRNTVTQSVYELGSAFKPIAMATAIDTGVVTNIARRFDATSPLQVGRYRIKDDHAQNRWLNIPETLIHSSNIATARIADEIGAARMQAMFRKMGFDTKPDIELIEKGRPLWPQYWARTTVMTTAYGHGIAVTPLHLANAYATLVNGGIWRPTTLLKIAPGHAPKGRRVIKDTTSARMRQLLRLIVTNGTGRKAEAPGYRVGGKTGTAEAAEGGGYARNRNVSTFAAAFPMDAPRYVVLTMMDSPKRVEANSFQTTAAYTAAPVVSRVISRTGAMLGVIPDAHRDVDMGELPNLLWHAPGEKKDVAE
ncbi:peptidoglycan D,D-transpeptidase FtsI family protein [Sphingomonas radiodurans]|uniref:peptidoglycan D,D-transpeptidase FtsI family protein n=1 Tax=Sphingomonas radiodurans TaxID=2890321 RepID=UPI001E517D9B|nr:penicillin-binding protein 2 [Sphingomonas radiodurans]WBH18351.1 penicillin-binding protein 2 [Sphingomonas radiodurans]